MFINQGYLCRHILTLFAVISPYHPCMTIIPHIKTFASILWPKKKEYPFINVCKRLKFISIASLPPWRDIARNIPNNCVLNTGV